MIYVIFYKYFYNDLWRSLFVRGWEEFVFFLKVIFLIVDDNV